jgi:hypothetical protein
VIVAHHGGELPAVVSALSGGVGAISVGAAIWRDRFVTWVRRPWRRT